MNCNICKRILNNPLDPFSADCGGDCVWCMIPIEFDIGDYDTCIALLKGAVEAVQGVKARAQHG